METREPFLEVNFTDLLEKYGVNKNCLQKGFLRFLLTPKIFQSGLMVNKINKNINKKSVFFNSC